MLRYSAKFGAILYLPMRAIKTLYVEPPKVTAILLPLRSSSRFIYGRVTRLNGISLKIGIRMRICSPRNIACIDGPKAEAN